jgi:sulfide:quinone oxidoreductase
MRHSKVVIIGGGIGGIGIAGRLATNKNFLRHEITVFEKQKHHYYKPGWTLVSSGILDFDKVRIPMSEALPMGVNLQENEIREVDPKNNRLYLDNGQVHTYENV